MSTQNRKRSRSHKKPRPAPRTPPVRSAPKQQAGGSLAAARYVVFDLETTGGNPQKSGITEICALIYENGEIKSTYHTLVNPKIPIPPIVRRMTGIHSGMLKDAPTIDQVMEPFLDFIGDGVLVSHNAQGDLKFLRHFAQEVCGVSLPNLFLCTHLLVERLLPEAPEKSLRGLGRFLNLPAGKLHRAEADAALTLELFKVLFDKLTARGLSTIAQAIRLQGDLDSGMRLGWSVPEEKLATLPPGMGLYYLFDHERKLLFVSSALSLQREVSKLQRYDQLPKAVLKQILRAYDIKIDRLPNSLQSMLAECEAAEKFGLPVSAVHLHQRQPLAIVHVVRGGQHYLHLGPVETGTQLALGPVRDRRRAAEYLEGLVPETGGVMTRHGLRLPEEQVPLALRRIMGERRFAQLQAGASSAPDGPSFWDRLKKAVRDLIGVESDAPSSRHAPAQDSGAGEVLHHLLELTGIAVVPDAGAQLWQLHLIVCGRPKESIPIKGDPEAKLQEGGLGRRLVERLERQQKEMGHSPVKLAEVERINAFLWWYQFGRDRGEGPFLPLAELKRLILTVGLVFAFFLSGNVAPLAAAESKKTEPPKTSRPSVTASIPPLARLTCAVAADAVNVRTALPAGASDHHFEPRPSDLKRLSSAQAAIGVGLGLDDAWFTAVLQGAARGGRIPRLNVGEVISGIPYDVPGFPSFAGSKGAVIKDPHFWVDPDALAEAGEKVAAFLAPVVDHPGLVQGAKALQITLAQLKREYAPKFAALRHVAVATFHPSLGYLQKNFQLHVAAVLFGNHFAEASGKQAVEWRAMLQREQVKLIITDPQHPSKMVDQLVQETKIRRLDLDMLGAGVSCNDGRDAAEKALVQWLKSFYDSLLQALAAVA